MPIPLPNLDDRAYADLVSEARALIPRYAPQWTDHNASDPGITLIELFAWLAEIINFRLNCIPEASEARFVELLGAVFQPASPVTVQLTVTATDLTVDSLVIPRGTPLTAQVPGRTTPLAFETLHDLQLTSAVPGGTLNARQAALLRDQPLGVSNGRPHQLVSLPRGQFVLFEEESGQPFPAFLGVVVGPEEWSYRSSLLQSTGSDRHFTVDVRLNALRFGDGNRGRIPPLGALITASYLSTLGREVNTSPSSVFDLDLTSVALPGPIIQALEQGASFSWSNLGVVQSGANPTTLEEARTGAITSLKTRWRGVTAADLEELALQQTQFQLDRAVCLPELDLTSEQPYAPAPGHVSIIIVPQSEEEMPRPDQETIDGVWAALDQHRLITCCHHVVGPGYTHLRVGARIVRSPRVEGERLGSDIQENLRAFFDPLRGGPEDQGWPFGRDVYASEVYQVIEQTSGVDHVDALGIYTREPEDEWTIVSERLNVPPNNLVHYVALADDLQIWAET
jgi:hypothetical protein